MQIKKKHTLSAKPNVTYYLDC